MTSPDKSFNLLSLIVSLFNNDWHCLMASGPMLVLGVPLLKEIIVRIVWLCHYLWSTQNWVTLIIFWTFLLQLIVGLGQIEFNFDQTFLLNVQHKCFIRVFLIKRFSKELSIWDRCRETLLAKAKEAQARNSGDSVFEWVKHKIFVPMRFYYCQLL